MKICEDSTEMYIGVDIEPTDIEGLPKGIQECYNGLCKYTKAEKVDALLTCAYNNENETNVQLHITVENNCLGISSETMCVGFFEDEDFVLTDQEKTAVKNSLVQLMAKNYMGEGVTKCV